jgi:hypothetical protein
LALTIHTRITAWGKYRFVKALTVTANESTAMLFISAISYTEWMGYELVTEITVLLTDSLSTADWKTFLRTEEKYGRRKSTQ